MINISDLSKLTEIINLTKLCEAANLEYGSMAQKVWRYSQGKPTELKVNESEAFTEALKKYGLEYKR